MEEEEMVLNMNNSQGFLLPWLLFFLFACCFFVFHLFVLLFLLFAYACVLLK